MKRRAVAEGKSMREMISFRQPPPIWLTFILVAVAFALALGMLTVLPLDRISIYLADFCTKEALLLSSFLCWSGLQTALSHDLDAAGEFRRLAREHF